MKKMTRKSKITLVLSAALAVTGVAGALTANAETVYDDLTGYRYSCYDVNKDGSVDAFDLACMKRFLLGDASDVTETALHNQEVIDSLLSIVREYINDSSADLMAQIAEVHIDAVPDPDSGEIFANAGTLVTVTFDKVLDESALYAVAMNYASEEQFKEAVAWVAENGVKSLRFVVDTNGVASCVPVLNNRVTTTVSTSEENTFAIIAALHLMENSPEWYARLVSMDIEANTANHNGVVTLTFDRPLNESALYALRESRIGDYETELAMVQATETYTMRMTIENESEIQCCVPVFAEEQTASVTTIEVDSNDPASVIPFTVKNYLMENSPVWYARMSSMDVSITQADGVVTVVFDRPLDELAVYELYKGSAGSTTTDEMVAFVEQNEVNAFRIVVDSYEIVSCEPVLDSTVSVSVSSAT